VAKIKQSPKRPAEERRRQLLAAAKRLFMKKGFRGTTTEDIARKAGLTKGAFYFHFHKKEDLLLELLNEMHEEVRKAFGALPAGRTNPSDFMKILMEKHSNVDVPEFGAFVDFWAEVMKIPKVRKHLQTCMAEGNKLVADRVDPRYGRSAQERADIGVMLFALFDGLTIRRMMFKESVDLKRQQRLFELMIQGLATMDRRQRK